MQSAAVLNISFNFDFLPILIVATLAWAIPMLKSLARLTKIPNAVLELALGYIIVSPLIDNFSGESVRILEFLALTGFIFLMFFTGLEIDVNKILYTISLRKISFKRFQKNPFLIGILIYIITLCIYCRDVKYYQNWQYLVFFPDNGYFFCWRDTYRA
jgi:Kef-type K+ transport system membrane component KefB